MKATTINLPPVDQVAPLVQQTVRSWYLHASRRRCKFTIPDGNPAPRAPRSEGMAHSHGRYPAHACNFCSGPATFQVLIGRDAAKHGIPFVSGDGVEHASRNRGYRGTWYGSFPPNLTSQSETSIGEKKADKSKGPRGCPHRLPSVHTCNPSMLRMRRLSVPGAAWWLQVAPALLQVACERQVRKLCNRTWARRERRRGDARMVARDRCGRRRRPRRWPRHRDARLVSRQRLIEMA